ncbi:5-dehydro-4-deoxyglucarate dehydratase [Saccharopolyspora spinosa]|uniref:Probable 5-dehydro-4-deoxyglucarate dehydratase n=1 Tax=Saccharopolyspora spinosa TaxID=60894 RepID=A0A2N3XZW9_SACSN|nr:5-dehydro-4-deoxyglucarate dehydratase [Saccharopolyspora spinosa]PKW16224.1 5-dehydro-4-deoxyglucarate dehydratase [Saccharopolyspora spinosa]
MMTRSPEDVMRRLGSGLLSFPVTTFHDDFSFDEKSYRDNIGWLCQHGAAGLFAAGGTGEFFSLTPNEVEHVIATAAAEAPDDIPVIGAAGYGTATAVEMAKACSRAGAAGILLLPPYLTGSPQDGLAAHVRAVCEATDLGVIVYNRANAVLRDDTLAELAETCPNLVGFKDGVGDLELMTRIHARLGDRFTYIGGLPTAETFALPYTELGVTTYSSAIYNFVPKFAVEFYNAVRAGDREHIQHGLNEFVIPYCKIRDRAAGYAVSIVKAGVRAIGRPAGPVRTPLRDLTPDEFTELTGLIANLS